MKKRAIFVLGIIFVFSSFSFTQTKTVTNADLKKYKEKRLAAEKDLRENYEKLGFPSPEELKRQNEQSTRDFIELSNRLRQEQIKRQNSQKRGVVLNRNENYFYRRNNSRTRLRFINYGRFYNYYRLRRHRNSDKPRHKRSRDFRQRFINGLPDYVLRNHRFTETTPRTNRRSIRRRHR